MQHILIENLDAYNFYADHGEKSRKRIWYTGSPWLLEYLPALKEEVVSIEASMEQSNMDALGMWAEELTRKIARGLDQTCNSGAFPLRMGEVLMPVIRRMLFPLLYRYFLLRHWVQEVERSGGTGTILGSTVLETKDLLPYRFDTLYAVLGNYMALPDCVRIVETPRVIATDREKQIKKTGTSRFERIMLMLNFNRETLYFKIWSLTQKRLFSILKPLVEKNLFRLSFWMNRPNVMLVDDCELSEEMLYHLFLRGCGVRRLRLKKGKEDPRSTQGAPTGVEGLTTTLREWLREGPGDFCLAEGDVGSLSNLILEILEKGVRDIVNSRSHMERLLQEVTVQGENGRARPQAILSNAFTSSFQRALFPLLREKHIPVFACEHGITGGLCLMNEHWIEENHLKLSDYCLCYSEVSEGYHRRVLNSPSKAFAVGMPDQNRKVRHRSLQKTLGKRELGLRESDRVVVYVCNLYYNNFIYSPGGCTDYYYHRVKKTVVYDVLGRTKDQCLLKLYPTFRYAEEDPFLHLMVLPPNVRPVQFIEYRYLRAVGDVVLCDSPQSTLGWVWSAGVPLIYLDLPSNPLLKHVAEAFDRAVFRIDCSREDWATEARDLLFLQPDELQRRWEEKKKDRDFVQEKYIFGPPGKAAKRAARLLIDEALRWHSVKREQGDPPLTREGTGRA